MAVLPSELGELRVPPTLSLKRRRGETRGPPLGCAHVAEETRRGAVSSSLNTGIFWGRNNAELRPSSPEGKKGVPPPFPGRVCGPVSTHHLQAHHSAHIGQSLTFNWLLGWPVTGPRQGYMHFGLSRVQLSVPRLLTCGLLLA